MLKRLHHLDTAHNTRYVPQVEQVVRFSRRRSQVLLGKPEHIDRGIHDLLKCASRISAHNAFTTHMRLNDLAKDALHHEFVEAAAGHDVEMASEPRCDRILASARRTHCADEDNICDFLQLIALVVVIIPLLVVHPLAQ